MVSLYVVSNEPYSGKTLTCLALGTRWRRRGLRVGYLKPVGLMPVAVEDEVTDEDAPFVADYLGFQASPSQLCPVMLEPATYEADPEELRARVKRAFDEVSAQADAMLIGGLGPMLSCGSTCGLSAATIAEMLDAKVVLVARGEPLLMVDSVTAARQALGKRLVGVIFNRVPASERERVAESIVPALVKHGAPVLGVVPDDSLLSSVSVAEIAKATGGELLCGADRSDQLVENLVVGAMGVDSALRYFRQTARKCVITGGDRIDIQFAALETSTRCLVLTGNLQPSHRVLARAQEVKIPVLMVREDTLTTVTVIEQLLGKQRVREAAKIEHALTQYERHLALEKLDAALGLGNG